MWVYLEKQGYDLATVNSSGLLPAGVQQVSGSNPGVCNTLVVAQQPHKHVWNCVLGLEIVRMYMCEWEKLSYIRQIKKNDISKFTLFPVPASQFWLRFFHLFYLYTVIQLHSISHLKFPYITRQTLCNVSERTRTIRRIPVTTNRYKPPPQESGVYVWVLLHPVAFLSHHQHFSSSLPGTVPPLSYFPAIHIHPLLYAVLYKCCVRCC